MYQSKLIAALHSRTVGILTLQFLIDAVSILSAHIQPDLLLIINLALSSLASYLHLNPVSITTPPGSTVVQTSPTTTTVTTPTPQ